MGRNSSSFLLRDTQITPGVLTPAKYILGASVHADHLDTVTKISPDKGEY